MRRLVAVGVGVVMLLSLMTPAAMAHHLPCHHSKNWYCKPVPCPLPDWWCKDIWIL